MKPDERTASDYALRFIMGTFAGCLVSLFVGICFGSTAGWISFVFIAPLLGLVTARFGYGLWRFLSELLSIP